jgi:hypothetical protein
VCFERARSAALARAAVVRAVLNRARSRTWRTIDAATTALAIVNFAGGPWSASNLTTATLALVDNTARLRVALHGTAPPGAVIQAAVATNVARLVAPPTTTRERAGGSICAILRATPVGATEGALGAVHAAGVTRIFAIDIAFCTAGTIEGAISRTSNVTSSCRARPITRLAVTQHAAGRVGFAGNIAAVRAGCFADHVTGTTAGVTTAVIAGANRGTSLRRSPPCACTTGAT